MEFKIARENILGPLRYITGIAEKKPLQPIYGNVLISSVKKDDQLGYLNLMASDRQIEISLKCPANSVNSNETTSVSAHKLAGICKLLSSKQEIDFSLSNDKNTVLIKTGNSNFKLATLPAEEFASYKTEDEETVEITIPQEVLKKAIAKTSYAISNNDVRYYLTGLLLEIEDGKMAFVTTDGHRMAIYKSDFETNKKVRVIIPNKTIGFLQKVLTASGDVILTISKTHITVSINDGEMVIKSSLIDGEFPKWQNVIPDNTIHLNLDKKDFENAIKQALILSNEKYQGLKLTINPTSLLISGKNSQLEEASGELDFESDSIIDTFEIGFNGKYLLESVQKVNGDKIILSLQNETNSCLINDFDSQSKETQGSQHIIMPMRL